MKFIINNNVVIQRQPEESENCSHNKIVSTKIGVRNYRHCESCGMVAHEDGSFSHYCGADYCKCGQ